LLFAPHVNNNPINYTDPTGHWGEIALPFGSLWSGIAGVAVVVGGVLLSPVVLTAAAVAAGVVVGVLVYQAINSTNEVGTVTTAGQTLSDEIKNPSEIYFEGKLVLDSTSNAGGLLTIGQSKKLPKAGDFPYVAPKQKGSPPYVRAPQGGSRDAKGNIWRRDKSGHGGPHWDVEHPDGSHTNVDERGEVIHGQ
jgi:hypothetical protein